MAGFGTRFGCQYKPFLRIGEKRFIEAAIAPFLEWQRQIDKIIFVYLEQHDKSYGVSKWINETFETLPVELVVLPVATSGPAITVCHAIKQTALEGQIICCDCDHAVNVEPLFGAIDAGGADAIIPVWPLGNEKITSWSVVAADRDGMALEVTEKRMPNAKGEVFGAIGCTYFRDVRRLVEIVEEQRITDLSQALQVMIRNRQCVRVVRIESTV